MAVTVARAQRISNPLETVAMAVGESPPAARN
jgi:hypothetical protein